jgi:kynurenine formamidase
MGHGSHEAALRSYLAHMDAGDYAAAIEMFSPDAVYVRPVISASASLPRLTELAGRQAILRSWEERGRRNIVHDIGSLVCDGAEAFVEGTATLDGAHTLHFCTYARFDDGGKVEHLIAHSAPFGAASGAAETGVPSYADLERRVDAPAGSSWGVFGAGDEIGAINFLTPETVRRGAAAVRSGQVFNLDYPLDAFPGPIRWRRPTRHVLQNIGTRPDGTLGPQEEESNLIDDYLDSFYPQGSSQIDGLRHVVHTEHGLYGGISRTDIRPGTQTLGVQRWAEHGIAGRGVLVDIARYRESIGEPLSHPDSDWIDVDLLEETLRQQGTEVLPGDMVLMRTAYPDHLRRHLDDDQAASRSAGLAPTRRMVSWLWDRQVPLVASDNIAVEATGSARPGDFGEGADSRLHAQLIPLLGLAIGELWKLDSLGEACAADRAYEFQLVCKPLNLVGGVGTPANATAIK